MSLQAAMYMYHTSQARIMFVLLQQRWGSSGSISPCYLRPEDRTTTLPVSLQRYGSHNLTIGACRNSHKLVLVYRTTWLMVDQVP